MTAKRVYLGGPDVFLANGQDIMDEKAALAVAAGFIPNIPGDNKSSPPLAATNPTDMSRSIFKADVALLTASDFGIFHLTPFRGVSADAGTCVEVGMMYAQKKPVFGYTNIAGDYLARVAPRQSVTTKAFGLGMADDMACHIEDFGNADNLMLDSAAALAGALIVRTDVPLLTRFTDLAGFKACLKQAQAYFANKDRQH